MGLLKDVTVALSDAGANILSAATQVGEQGVVRMRFLVSISDTSLLDTLFAFVNSRAFCLRRSSYYAR